jgi:mannose-6-phosphate isomerase-like protein (cupin superfamily)
VNQINGRSDCDDTFTRATLNQRNAMKPAIKSLSLEREFYTSENCYITELSNTPDDPDVSIARARVAPGEITRWHWLRGTVERYYILSGAGRVEIGNLPPQEVNPGNIVLIPSMCRQRISNVGTGDLIFLAICTPRFSQEAYEDVDAGAN